VTRELQEMESGLPMLPASKLRKRRTQIDSLKISTPDFSARNAVALCVFLARCLFPSALLADHRGPARRSRRAEISTVMKPTATIYPVCVSDEPAVENFFFTTYSNEIFQKELSAGSRLQPVTMMSINELEEILP